MTSSVTVKLPRLRPSPSQNVLTTHIDMNNCHLEDKFPFFKDHLVKYFTQDSKISLQEFRKMHTQDFAVNLFNLLDDKSIGILRIGEFIGQFRKMKVSGHHVNQLRELNLIYSIYANKRKEIKVEAFIKMVMDQEFQIVFFSLFKNDITDTQISYQDFYQGLEKLPKITDDESYIYWLHNMLHQMAPTKTRIQLEDFKKILQTRHEVIGSRIFFALTNGEDEITLNELMWNLGEIFLSSSDKKVELLFKIYDTNDDGTISKKELELILKSCMEEWTVSFSQLTLDGLTDSMWDTIKEYSHPNNQGLESYEINVDDFKLGLHYFPQLVDNISISFFIRGGLRKVLVEQQVGASLPPDEHAMGTCAKTRNYFLNNISLMVCIIVLICINFVLGVEAASRYWHNHNECVVIARVCGQLLNFNSAIVLLFVCRYFLTELRASCLTHYLPIDKAMTFHRRIASFIVVLASIHTLTHVINMGLLSKKYYEKGEGNYSMTHYLFSTKPGWGWVAGSAPITGWILWLILVIMVLMTLPVVRHKGYFQAFYWTHHLFIAYELVMILHGPSFWKWLLAPGIIYVIDRILRFSFVNKIVFGKTVIQDANICESKVVQLKLSRQRMFTFNAGDYVFINIPEIAKYEWHPFTISSPPENTDYFTVHIRAVGHWTNKLYKIVSDKKTAEEACHKMSGFVNIGFDKEESNLKLLLRRQSRSALAVSDKEMKANDTKKVETSSIEDSVCAIESISYANEANSVPHECEQRNKTISFFIGENERDPETEITPENNAVKINNNKTPISTNHVQIDVSGNEDAITNSILGTVHVQGPFGSASRSIFEAQHAVMVCTGIGVTPFASILQSIFYQMLTRLFLCPDCGTTGVNDIGLTNTLSRTLQRLDFYWINRTHNAFEWFLDILRDLEDADHLHQSTTGQKDSLGLHLYLTGAPNDSDIKTVALKLALEMAYKRLERDLLSGLKTRIKTGRPDWKSEFEMLKSMNKGKVTIFYCGVPYLKKQLKHLATQYDFEFREEVF